MLRFALLFTLLRPEFSSFATVRSFYCNWVNNTWSAPTNWIPAGTPANGDVLIFSASSPRTDCINDLLNLKLDSLQISGGASAAMD